MASEKYDATFHSCYSKLKDLKIADVDVLNHLIDQLNALNFPSISIENEVAEDLLCQIIHLIPQENDHLLTKFCSLVYLFLNKQERALSADCVQKLTKFIISALQNCGECFLSDVLIGFSALLYGNGHKIEKFHQDLVGENGILINMIVPFKHDQNIQYYAFQCIFNLLTKNPDNFMQKEYFDICYQQFINVMKKSIEQNSTDILSVKILISCIKCLHLLFMTKNTLGENLGELLGTLKCLLFYGLPGPTMNDFFLYPTLPSPDINHVVDSQGESDSVTYPKLRKQKRVRRIKQKRAPQKKEHEEKQNVNSSYSEEAGMLPSSPSSERSFYDVKIKSSSSDSEYSDAENSSSKIKSHQASVRQMAYQVLQSVVKNTDKKIMFSYWSSFLPDHPAIPGMAYGQNIFTSILKDPIPQVRLGALVLLTEMLRGSKNFLSFADGRSSRHSSFTSLSTIIATIISELHRCLLLALLSETSSLLLTQILKCYAVLCENTPYTKLNDEILLKLLKHVKGFLHHKDAQVQVASLIVFQFIVKSDQVPESIGNIIISPDFDSAINNINLASLDQSTNGPNTEVPWMIYICKKNIFRDELLPMRIESVQLLSCIVGKYFHKIYCTLPVLEEVILFCLGNTDSSLQLHGAKLLDVFGRCVFNDSESKMTEEEHLTVKKLWQNVINGPFVANITDDSQKSLLAVCCDCLSTLPVDVFEELPGKQQIFYITVLLGLATDSHPIVRGAAVRCLGVYCLFPSLSKDFSFLSDVSEILVKCVDDSSVNVRFKASWSLGKLSDALFENNSSSIQNQISEQFFYSTAMACVQYSKDCDKVRANSVRALGIFLYHLPKEFMENQKMPHFVKSACTVLQSSLSASAVKVCWNVCYAFGKMLKNTMLLEQGVIDLEDVLTALLNTLKSPNFKVRISAAQALTVLQSRYLYGKLFPVIWFQLLDALFSVGNDVNFKEIKHQENLSDQICSSLCKLVLLITVEDLLIISGETIEAREILLTSMWKFGSRTSAEKIQEVCSAIEHINILSIEDINGLIQISSVLQDILNQVAIAFYGQDVK